MAGLAELLTVPPASCSVDPDRLLCRNWPQCSSAMTSVEVGLVLQLQLQINLFEFVYMWQAGDMTRMNCWNCDSQLSFHQQFSSTVLAVMGLLCS